MNKNLVIYEDNDIIVCHKPPRMATEGARVGSMDLVSSVRNYLARQNRGVNGKKPAVPYVGTVHRLDNPVEGVVVMAKTKKAATDISAQIKDRTTDKYYYAFCYGTFEDKKGHLSNMLVRKKVDKLAAVLEEGGKLDTISGDAKKAELDYEVIAEKDNCSLLRIKLLTGRFHQIRVQLSYIGHPILGDNNYESAESKSLSTELGIRDVCLVCYKFVIDHPTTRKRVEFTITPDNKYIAEML